jgi:hypothetical protein
LIEETLLLIRCDRTVIVVLKLNNEIFDSFIGELMEERKKSEVNPYQRCLEK